MGLPGAEVGFAYFFVELDAEEENQKGMEFGKGILEISHMFGSSNRR